MEKSREEKIAASRKRRESESFEVTCTIGEVALADSMDGLSPNQAAFVLIAQHNAPGKFSFPNIENGSGYVVVDVMYQDDPSTI